MGCCFSDDNQINDKELIIEIIDNLLIKNMNESVFLNLMYELSTMNDKCQKEKIINRINILRRDDYYEIIIWDLILSQLKNNFSIKDLQFYITPFLKYDDDIHAIKSLYNIFLFKNNKNCISFLELEKILMDYLWFFTNKISSSICENNINTLSKKENTDLQLKLYQMNTIIFTSSNTKEKIHKIIYPFISEKEINFETFKKIFFDYRIWEYKHIINLFD